MAKIGFVGLGHMGLHMAANLIKNQHDVTGFDIQKTARDNLKALGGTIANSAKEVATDQDIIITMLQTGQQVKEVTSGDDGLFANAKLGALYMDCSTIDVPNSRAIHQEAQRWQLLSVDAPVSGGMAGAMAATLTFMVGGDERACQMAEPILLCMGKKVIYTGHAGSGMAAKICNNMILGVSMIAVSEAFLLAKKLGLSAQKLFDVVTNASGQCWVMNQYVPVPGILEHVPANHDYQPGFTGDMMLKDLNLSQTLAKHCQVETPISQHANELYQSLHETGMGHLDFSVIIKALAKEKLPK